MEGAYYQEGSTRHGVDKGGKKWSQTLSADYGYFSGGKKAAPKGPDNDPIDVFIGPDLESDCVVVIDQMIDGKFDEHKVVVGTKSISEAKKLYLSNYSKGWVCGPTTETTVAGLKEWLKSGDTLKPFAKFEKAARMSVAGLLRKAITPRPFSAANVVRSIANPMSASARSPLGAVENVLETSLPVRTMLNNAAMSRRQFSRFATQRAEDMLPSPVQGLRAVMSAGQASVKPPNPAVAALVPGNYSRRGFLQRLLLSANDPTVRAGIAQSPKLIANTAVTAFKALPI